VNKLGELQHTVTNGDEIWWYQDKGPQMRVWRNEHGPAYRRWEVKVYPTYRDCWMTHTTWYHDAFPLKRYAIHAGQEKLREAALFYEGDDRA